MLSEATDDLDYRLWIDGRHPVTLERVELDTRRAPCRRKRPLPAP